MASVKQNLNLNDVGNIRDKKQYTIDDFLNSNPPSEIKAQEMVPESFSSNGVQSKNQELPKINLPAPEQIEASQAAMAAPVPMSEQPQLPAMTGQQAPSEPGQGGPLASFAPLLASMAKPQTDQTTIDPFVAKYAQQQEGLLAKREEEASKLASSEKLTNQEKISQALLAILPGLLGAGLGAAVTGGMGGNAGLGALQGLAGGTQGSLQGLQMLDQDKKDKVKQIRDNIKVIDDKLDKTGLKEEARAGLLEERGIQEKRLGDQFANQMSLEKVKQDFESGLLDKKTAAEAEHLIKQGEIQKAVTLLNNNSAEKREGMQNATSLAIANINANSHILGAQLAAGAAGAKSEKLNDGQSKAATYLNAIVAAEKDLSKPHKYDPTSRLKMPDSTPDRLKSSERLNYEASRLAWLNNVNYLRSGAGQQEIEAGRALKEFFPVDGDDSKTVQEKLERRQNFAKNTVDAYNLKNHVEVPTTSSGETKQAPHGQTVVQNGHTYNWNAQTGQYE